MGLVTIDLSSGPKEETDDHAGYVFPIRDSKDESPYRRPIHQTGHRLTTDPNDKSRHWTRQPLSPVRTPARWAWSPLIYQAALRRKLMIMLDTYFPYVIPRTKALIVLG